MLSSIRSLKRKWFCPIEKFGVFQQYLPIAALLEGLNERLLLAESTSYQKHDEGLLTGNCPVTEGGLLKFEVHQQR